MRQDGVTEGFRVICEDGIVRHKGLFVGRHAAQEFASWGHCCTNNHRYVYVEGDLRMHEDGN